MGSVAIGMKRSGRCVGSAPINALGITPTTVNSVLSICSFCPITLGARLNHRCQNDSLITTPNPAGSPPLRSSAGASVRPNSGAVLSALKNLPADKLPRLALVAAAIFHLHGRLVEGEDLRENLPLLLQHAKNRLREAVVRYRAFPYRVRITASRSLSGTGSGRSSSPSIIEKTVVFAPTPSASVNRATVVKPGDFAKHPGGESHIAPQVLKAPKLP